jgi:hypothetical protein
MRSARHRAPNTAKQLTTLTNTRRPTPTPPVRRPAPRQQTFRIFGQLPLQAYVAATTALCNQTAPTAKPWCPGATPSPFKRFSKNLQELLLIK